MQELQNEHRIYSTAERRSAVEHAERVVAAGGTVADAAPELAIPVKKLCTSSAQRPRRLLPDAAAAFEAKVSSRALAALALMA